MPASPTKGPQAQALMVDLDHSNDLDSPRGYDLGGSDEREVEDGKHGRVRLKSISRPKSYHQILEDFQQGGQNFLPGSPSTVLVDSLIEESSESNGEENDTLQDSPPSIHFSQPPSPSPRRRREDTARRSKRFSVPAIALHTTNVTAKIASATGGPNPNGSRNISGSLEGVGNHGSGVVSRVGGNESGVIGRLRRLSLVTGGRNPKPGNDEGSPVEGIAARKLAEALAKGALN